MLVILFGPVANFDLRRERLFVDVSFRHRQGHEQARVLAESFGQKGLRRYSGVMGQQLRFNAVNSRRLLQGFDYMGKQAGLDLSVSEFLRA